MDVVQSTSIRAKPPKKDRPNSPCAIICLLMSSVSLTYSHKKVNLSRFIVTLRDVSLANKEEIQKLGAKGIVEIDNQLKIILGPNSKQLKRYIDELKKS